MSARFTAILLLTTFTRAEVPNVTVVKEGLIEAFAPVEDRTFESSAVIVQGGLGGDQQ